LALSPSIKTLLTRSISAVVAVLVVGLLFYFFQGNAIRILCLFAVVAGGRELTRILFDDCSKLIRGFFYASAILVFLLSSSRPDHSGLTIALFSILFCLFSMIFGGKNRTPTQSLEQLFFLQAKGLLGFLYIGLLPSFVFQFYYAKLGEVWFFLLLSVVFACDTMAYLFGVRWGKHKIMPNVSPKKTLEGSLGGLLGSTCVSVAFSSLLTDVPLWAFVLIGISVGIVAQLGDLFESLMKRMANRKDSGSIMPGHGGVLDRLDGLLFAAPIVYFFSQWFTSN
jgi:phosphatidate cytidylyltransferase